MWFEKEDDVAEVLRKQAESKSGLNSAFLYGTEPLNSTDHDYRTLRVNCDLFGYEEDGIYPGTLYTSDDQDVDENIWISFEPEENFPDSTSAQTILSEEPTRTPSGQVVHYTTAPIEGLEEFSGESEINGIESHLRNLKN